MRHKDVSDTQSLRGLFSRGVSDKTHSRASERITLEIAPEQRDFLIALSDKAEILSMWVSEELWELSYFPSGKTLGWDITQFEVLFFASALKLLGTEQPLTTDEQGIINTVVSQIKEKLLEAGNVAAFAFLGGDENAS